MSSKDGSSKGLLVRALAMAAMAAVTTASAFAGELIAPFKGKVSEKALASDSAYQALAGSPATAAIEVVKANPRALEAGTQRISLALPSGLRLRIRKVDSQVTESGSVLWYGVVLNPGGRGLDFDPLNTLTVVRNNGKITGNLRYKGQWYQIRPLQNGSHVLVTVDQSQVPSDDPADPLPSVPMAVDADAAMNKVNTVITVLVSYTPAAASASGDIDSLIDLAFWEANQSYTTSGVAITLQLAKKARVTYTESNNSATDVSRYQGTSDGYMDYIHTQRTQYGADVAILLVGSLEFGIAGRASGIGSSATTAFAVVHQLYATGNYTFAHEIGHLQSARHDPAADPSTTPYAFGHGYVYNGSPSWRTIMATGSNPRQN
ncbi:MAG TPA: M12 family metallo-peptidase, partial [Thermoanaerobaculia bacterium]|nr:M12 family metallo-peptidase [Thermoanaerobaculia bacterium]